MTRVILSLTVLMLLQEISGLIRSRRLAVTRMFHDSTVYSLFLKILYDGYNCIKTSDKQVRRVVEISGCANNV